MKKSTYVIIIAVLAAIAGALVAVAIYLNRREKELEDYEQLLFTEEFDDAELDELAATEPEEEAPVEEV
ncbi:MAG: phosphatase [Faecalibacterium sp.]